MPPECSNNILIARLVGVRRKQATRGAACQRELKLGSRIAAAARKKSETRDEENDHKQANPSEATHPPTYAPAPVAAHHSTRAGPVGLRIRGQAHNSKSQRGGEKHVIVSL